MRDAVKPGGEPARIVQLLQVLKCLQKHVLSQVERILAIAHQAQQIVVDALLPSRHQDVIRIDVSPPRLRDQVAILNLPKYQISAPL